MGDLQIRQDSKYVGHDRWKWRVWVDADPVDLNKVNSVTWKLHQTFPQPIVETTNRGENFSIERTGWGAFEIRAEVQLNDGTAKELRHMLDLEYPEEAQRERRRARKKRVQIYLSYTAENARFANRVRESIRRAGYDVADGNDLPAGLPWPVAMRKGLQTSDALVVIVTDDVSSTWMHMELVEAQKLGLPAVILQKRGVALDLAAIPAASSAEVVQFDATNPDAVVTDLLSRAKITPR
jgi:hypothetical protein